MAPWSHISLQLGLIDRHSRLNVRQRALVRKGHEENISDEPAGSRWAQGSSFVPRLARKSNEGPTPE
jgi:hypothetical protein